MRQRVLIIACNIFAAAICLTCASFAFTTNSDSSTQFTLQRFAQSYAPRATHSFQGRTNETDGKAIVSYKWKTHHPGGKVLHLFTDNTGEHETKAHFIKYDKSKFEYHLEKEDGEKIKVPHKKLSTKDQLWLLREKRRRMEFAKGDKSYGGEELEVKVPIDIARKEEAVESFGLPDKWSQIEYTTARELLEKQDKLISELAARGMNLPLAAKTPSHNYDWVIDESKGDVKDLTKELHKLAKNIGYVSQRGLLTVLASFVQSMEYEEPPTSYVHKDFGKVRTGGISMPLETLYRGSGDCDTKSLLFASLMANIPNQNVVFLVGKEHLFVGVRGVPMPGERHVTLQGAKYVLIEMTYPWPIGEIPDDEWGAYKQGKYKVVKVVGN